MPHPAIISSQHPPPARKWNALLAGLGLLAYSCLVSAGTIQVQTGHSALWHNPQRSGEGWMLEILDQEQANVYWYTYDDFGNQRWLTGQGFIEGDSILFPDMLVTSGGRFGPDFDPEAVVREVVGELRLTFDDCTTGQAEYQMFGQAGSIAIERLSATMAIDCPPFSSRPSRSQGAHSGSWYDPEHSGEGFVLQWMDRGQALLTWFSYDTDGNQYWMIGVGELDDDRRLQFGLNATRGGRFGADFDPDEVELIDWGTLTMDLGCLDGTIEYQSELSEFDSAIQDVTRLTMLAGLECPFFMPEVGAIEDARWDTRFTTAGLHGPMQPSVHDLLVLPGGGVLAAGRFGSLGGTLVPPLVSGSAADGNWKAFDPANALAAMEVTALAQSGSHPLAFAASDPDRIMLVEDSELVTNGELDGLVHRLTWHDGQLWVAGDFALVGRDPARLATWDGDSWQAAPGGEPDGPAMALLSTAEGLYVGGQFDQIGGIDAESVARWDGQEWQAFRR